jgi:hypothetical protein
MKNLLWSLLAIASFFSSGLKAQTIRYKQTELGKTNVSHYIGSDEKYHYYSDTLNSYIRIDVSNFNIRKEFKFITDKEIVSPTDVYFLNHNIYALLKTTEKKNDSKITSTKMLIFKIDPASGSVDKKIEYSHNDSGGYFKFFVDTVQNRFFIKKIGYGLFYKKNDSIYAVYNLELNPTSETQSSEAKRKPVYGAELTNATSNNYGGYLHNLRLKFLSRGSSLYSDSLSTKNYKFTFVRSFNLDIYFFSHELEYIVIESKNKNNKVKSVDFAISIDKNIIDINYREAKNGNLIVFGKYIQKGKSSSSYGLFSCVFDANLNEIVGLKYFDLVNIPNIKYNDNVVPNQKYVGFIFNDLFDADYEFYFDEQNAFVFTYQKNYDNVHDHVYLLKVEANGQMIVNVVYNQINKDKNLEGSKKHMALRVGNKIHILFYDNADNIAKEVGNQDIKVTKLGNKNSVLACTTYKLLDDDFTKKIVIADIETLGNLPNFKDPIIYYNPEFSQYTAIVKGMSISGELKSLFEFIYVD